jgi:hypothetical protein
MKNFEDLYANARRDNKLLQLELDSTRYADCETWSAPFERLSRAGTDWKVEIRRASFGFLTRLGQG